ncbi:MAG: DUF58 domain-containing protein [Rhodospirillaceae bacterium]
MAGGGDTALAVRQRAEQLAARLPPLLVAAHRIAATVAAGVHGRRRAGRGDGFWQFRRYQSGDAAALIDWRQSARTQPLYVRETEREAAQSVWLWADRSGSMDYRSAAALPGAKREHAELLLLALGVLLVRAGERVALLGGGQRPGAGAPALEGLALALPERTAGLPEPEALPRHARLVLVGDLLSPLAETGQLIGRFSARGVRGHLLQVLDPAEETLPFSGRVAFSGFEGEETLLVPRVETVRAAYHARLAGHRAGLAALARDAGWSFAVHRTDRPPQAALLALVTVLGQP